MSLAAAFHAAASGLAVTARRSETVSNNVANAETEGYARRSLSTTSAPSGSGVRALATERHVDAALLTETRVARAAAAGSDYLARQINRLEDGFAKAGSAHGLVASIDRLDGALVAATGDPSSTTRLAELADSLRNLASGFAAASDRIQSMRSEADARIAADVEALNAGLSRVASLDRQITIWTSAGRDTSALRDQRQASIDGLAAILPLRESTGSDGRTRLVTSGGAVLLDGAPVRLSFTRTPILTATGPVPGQLMMDGRAIPMQDGGPLSGGTLSAAFALRDDVAPVTQAALDALAADLAQRLALADATRPAGAAGLLTDRGAPIDPGSIAGLSSRLTLNSAVDPDTAGDLWRLRSGLGAATAGAPGDSTLLSALHDAVSQEPGSPQTAAARLAETVTAHRVRSEKESAAAAGRAGVFAQQLAQGGVDTDAEMQGLLVIEQTYAANAKVLQAIRDMLDFLLMR